MKEGKMERKDQYINYKNKELLYLVTEEWEAMLKKLKKHIKKNNQDNLYKNCPKSYIKEMYNELFE